MVGRIGLGIELELVPGARPSSVALVSDMAWSAPTAPQLLMIVLIDK
jgi:hypothetical protein